MNHIVISTAGIRLAAELNDSPTARAVWDALPIEADGSTWGDEIYFAIPVSADEAPDARCDVEIGELAFWPPGSAFCIFYGRTPASTGSAPRAASEVNIIGRVTGDATLLRAVRGSVRVRVERA